MNKNIGTKITAVGIVIVIAVLFWNAAKPTNGAIVAIDKDVKIAELEKTISDFKTFKVVKDHEQVIHKVFYEAKDIEKYITADNIELIPLTNCK